MPEIIKVYKEVFPPLQLIGRMYTNADRNASGSFSDIWCLWFAEKLFAPLDEIDNSDYVGAMRVNSGVFEYWIGKLLPVGTEAPEGYSAVEIPGGSFGVCWISGKESDSQIYQMDKECVTAMAAQQMYPDGGWFMERYNCPRFTTPNENGEIILDFLASLK